MSEPDQGAAAAAAAVARPAPASLFIVERRLPKASEHHSPCSRRAALSGAALRFSARGDSGRYLYSILLARQQRLLSLFTADRLEAVRVGNAAEALDLRGGCVRGHEKVPMCGQVEVPGCGQLEVPISRSSCRPGS